MSKAPISPWPSTRFGSYWRMNQALGTENLEALAGRVQKPGEAGNPHDADGEDEEAARPDQDGELSAKIGPQAESASRWCLEGDRADLTRLPIIQCWPLDGNLDSGQVFDQEAMQPRSPSAAPDGTSLSPASTRRNPDNRRPQHRHVSRAAVWPAKMRNALAHASRRGAPFPHVPSAR